MIDVVGVNFKSNGRVYYFSTNGLDIDIDDKVIVETEKGLQFAFVAIKKEIDENSFSSVIKNVLRKATDSDFKQYEKNQLEAEKAIIEARRLIDKLELDMRIIDANFTFDRNQLLFNFLADERVDFRELAKRLAQIYKTRIELRQIGVRDKAKEIGGIGPCGRFLCCNQFLTDFNSVSINMAKNQYISLNPTKINGVCGRLLCCLKYEDEVYTELKKGLPSVGEIYSNDDIVGKVVSVDVFRKVITVEDKNKNQTIVELDNGSTK